MNKPLLFNLEDHFKAPLAALDDVEMGALFQRTFPDGESYVRLDTNVAGRDVFFIGSLNQPNAKTLPLLFAAQAARAQRARSVQLVAPYLAYLRQDEAFQSGEAVTAHSFASLLSGFFDHLITLDPHLHRIGALERVYQIPTTTLHAAHPIAEWIKGNVENPLLIGPDAESEQWVRDVARRLACPFVICRKTRSGDRQVKIDLPPLPENAGLTPVLLDDIVSTGQTMIQTLKLVTQHTQTPPVCIAIHAVFSDESLLKQLGHARLLTCNTIAHHTNLIDVSSLIVTAIKSASSRWNS
ncbi:MAG: ribose-phosphate diphosphokinase [Acidobacteria bacterium]|nr:ribose-phosphate diphosphokinase [Acidobacteriota bacterium]